MRDNAIDAYQLPDEDNRHKEVILAFVERAIESEEENAGIDFDGIPQDLWKDEGFVLRLVRYNVDSMEFAHADLKSSKDFALNAVEAVREGRNVLQYFDESVKTNREVVVAAVTKDGISIKNAPDFINNEEIARIAVAQNPSAVPFLSEGLKDNDEIMLMAIEKYGFIAEYASERLRSDMNFVFEALRKGASLKYLTIDLSDEENMAKMVKLLEEHLKHFHNLFIDLPKELREDLRLLTVAARVDPIHLHYVDEKLWSHPKIVEALSEKPYDTSILWGNPDLNELNDYVRKIWNKAIDTQAK